MAAKASSSAPSSSSSRVQWRKFAFFEKEILESDLSQTRTCGAASNGVVVLGDAEGYITIADANFRFSDRRYKIFRGEVRGVAYLFDASNNRRQFVVAVGDDSRADEAISSGGGGGGGGGGAAITGGGYVIKIFHANDFSRPVHAFHASPGVPSDVLLTSFAVLSDGSQIAVGFSNRTVLLFAGAFLLESTSMRQIIPTVLFASRSVVMPVSGLYFCELSASSAASKDRRIRLFAILDTDVSKTAAAATGGGAAAETYEAAAAEGGIVVFDTSTTTLVGTNTVVPAQRRAPHVLDDRGAAPHCSTLMKETCELVVGRAEGVFSYSVDDRGGAAGFEGDKQCVSAVSRYILVSCVDDKTKRTNVTIYDLRNKFISFNTPLPLNERVHLVLNDGGMAYIITAPSMSLIRFRERDTQSKLELLRRKSLFPLAISLAAEEQCDVSEIMKLYEAYADHLFKKGEFDASTVQFCHTIGYVQPSYVVRKFLDPHRITNLVTYLEKLQEKGMATNDHVTLLLTCYSKMKVSEKIAEFVEHSAPSLELTATALSSPPAQVNFDVDEAASILHQAGFVDHALRLALKFQRHNPYLHLLIDKPRGEGLDAAMLHLTELMLTLDIGDIVELVSTHGKKLLTARPEAMTALLIKLCRGELNALRAKERAESGFGPNDSDASLKNLVEKFLFIFVDDAKHLQHFLEGVFYNASSSSSSFSLNSSMRMALPPVAADTLLELYLHDYSHQRKELDELKANCKASKSRSPQLGPLGDALQSLEKKIMIFLDSAEAHYDPSQALLLTHAFGLEQGERFLLEKLHSVDLLMRMYIESRDETNMKKLLRREGGKDPELYVQVLSFLVQQSMENEAAPRSEEEEEERWDAVIEVLSLIESENALSAGQVVSILSTNPQLPLHVASNFLRSCLMQVTEEVREAEQAVQSSSAILENIAQEEILRKQAPGAGMGAADKAALRAQARAAKRVLMKKSGGVSAGGGNLDYSDDEFEEEEEEEEMAEMENAALEEQERALDTTKWIGIKKAMIKRANDHETFFAELEGSSDGFNTVAQSYGKILLR